MAYKHDYDKILTRLTVILSRLNDGEFLSTKELAQEFNVSARTVQRDFNERLISFPIYQHNNKWKMQDGFRLEKSTSVEDAVILDIMEKLIEGAGESFSIKATKLLNKIKNDSQNPIYARLDIEDIGYKIGEIRLLEEAIRNKQEITCTYSFDTYSKTVELKPLKIANYDGFWYLIALDARNDHLKKYYLKNITQIVMKDKYFERDQKLDTLLENSMSIWFDEDVQPYRVMMEVSAGVSKYFRRKPISSTQRIESLHEDGSMLLSVDVTHDMEIIPFVKRWVPDIKITEPEYLHEAIQKDLQSYLTNKNI
jgi:predicted DNA-binding transcriptional regulator YafY